jgi:hypothetical protein
MRKDEKNTTNQEAIAKGVGMLNQLNKNIL